MEHITSLKNPKVAAWKALKDRKGRRESGCFLVEGRKMVEEALASAFDVETVLVQEGMELPDGLTMPVYELPEHVLTAVCDTKTPQGIAAVVRMKEQSALGKHIVVLDGVQDPGNVGTIIRTADGAGRRAALDSVRGCVQPEGAARDDGQHLPHEPAHDGRFARRTDEAARKGVQHPVLAVRRYAVL